MATAMVKGILKAGLATPSDIHCLCGQDDTGKTLAAATGIGYGMDPSKALQAADILILACKPQQLAELDQAAIEQSKDKLILSILAGIPLQRLQQVFPHARAIIRAMPNTPGQIGAGITAYSTDNDLFAEDRQISEGILASLGTVLAVPEAQLDAVTAISGSGPGYLFEYASAMREAAIALGLDSHTADLLVRHTLYGSSRLLLESDESADTLRDHVTSPAGTTEAGLNVLAERKFRQIICQATAAACARSAALAKL